MRKNEFSVKPPCSRERDSLEGAAGSVRWCPDCRKSVYDFSRLTRREIDALCGGGGGADLCAIIEREPDGQLRTAEGPSWPRILRRRFLRWAALFGAASWKLGFAQEWKPGRGGVRGVVVDSTGAAIANTRVSTSTGESVLTDSLGRYSFRDLAPGQLTLRVEAAGFDARKIDLVVKAGAFVDVGNLVLNVDSTMGGSAYGPADIAPRLTEPRLAGLVTDQTGAALAGAELALTGSSGVRWRTTSAGNGSFSVAPLRWGDYRLEVTAAGYSSHQSHVSIEALRGDTVRIALEPKR
jgi:hypothetical protein